MSPTTSVANSYQVASLIFALTTPPEQTSKLAPRWKGPYRVCRIPNEYQIVYEDRGFERTIHINHAKPAKFAAPDLPEPVPPAEAPRPPLGYLPAGLAHRPPKPRAPPVNHNVDPAPSPTAPAEPIMPPPATAPVNQRPEPAPPRQRSPRLNPGQDQAHAILNPPCSPGHLTLHPATAQRTAPRWPAPTLSLLGTTNPWGRRRIPFPLPVFDWWISGIDTTSTSAPWGSSLMPCSKRWTLLPASRCKPHCPSRTAPPSPLHASRHVVPTTFRWGLPPLLHIATVLLNTPGTACGLTRG